MSTKGGTMATRAQTLVQAQNLNIHNKGGAAKARADESKAQQKPGVGIRKALANITNSEKPYFHKESKKNQLNKCANKEVPIVIEEEQYQHNHQCCVSLQTKISTQHFLNQILPLDDEKSPLELWSPKTPSTVLNQAKDPALESAVSRNRRWIVNTQLKNIILRCPNQIAPFRYLQKKFKTLDLQGKALNWLRKYPCCFGVFLENDENYCQLTKRMIALVEEEESIREQQEQVMVEKLAKLLVMSCNRRLNVVKFNELRQNFGLPYDYLVRILPKYP
ncbi:hypothetical protein MRB53_008332 [Persea americana]|uniref:Uncharacterized protein n=1 Tax=Persea americana TaxID=3435 RepID=A0ACC2MLH0_PERAE|nr:hypothetical protein MRB53_008332 [Persea americana]